MRKDFVKDVIQPTFVADLVKILDTKEAMAQCVPLLRLVAEVLDEAAQGEDCYLSIGVTKKRNAAVLTLTLNGDRSYASGNGFAALMASIQSLL